MPKACFVVGVTVTDLAKRKAFDKCYQAICLTTNEMDNAPMSTLFAFLQSSVRLHAGCGDRDRVHADPAGADAGISAAVAGHRSRARHRGRAVVGDRVAPGVLLREGQEYYCHSHAFLTKFSLFIIIGLLSIIPTREFLSWRGAIEAGQAPVIATAKRKRVTMVLHIELAAIAVILLCAAIMARGGWV
jgi:hypothetical protein